MNVRYLLVAASAAALLAGTAYGASAKSFSVGKSSSEIHVVAHADPVNGPIPVLTDEWSDVTINGSGKQNAYSQDGGGKATAASSTNGSGSAIEAHVGSDGQGSAASASGGTHGYASAGG